MTQAQLVCAVARVTGESVETIKRRGFTPMKLPSSRRRAHRRGHRTYPLTLAPKDR